MTPIDAATALLLHFDGANGSTAVTDSSLLKTPVTLYGTAKLSTTAPHFGSANIVFDGTSGCGAQLTLPVGLRTGDLTVEFLVRPSAAGAGRFGRFLQLGANETPGGLWIVNADVSGASPAGILVQVRETGGYITLGVSDTLPLNEWSHVALVRSAGLWSFWRRGVCDWTNSYGGAGNDLIATSVSLGYNGFGEAAACGIDELRIARTVVYDSPFAPPAAAFSDPAPIEGASRPPPPRRVVGSQPAYPASPQRLARPVNFSDRYYGGRGYLPGTVKKKDTPANVPLHRRVWLLRERDAVVIRETWSDAVTGAYVFTGLDETQRYSVISYDHTLDKRAVIANNLTPNV